MVSVLQDWVLQLVSTDLALRCLFEHNCSDEDDEPPTKRVKLYHNEGACDDIKPVPSTEGREIGKKLIVSGLAIALCCHHRCDWRHYVGKEFFRQKGLGPEEFAAFQRMSSWATCGMRKFGSKITEKPSEHKTEEEHEMSEEALPDTLNGWVFWWSTNTNCIKIMISFVNVFLAVWCQLKIGNRSDGFVNVWLTMADCITSSKEALKPAWNTTQAETFHWRMCY